MWLLCVAWQIHSGVAGWDQLTRGPLLVVVAEQARLVEQQELRIEALTKQVAELTCVGQQSGSSSLPCRRTGARRRPGHSGVADPPRDDEAVAAW